MPVNAAEAEAERRALLGVLAGTVSVQALATWSVLALAAMAPLVAEAVGLPPVLIGYQISLVYAVAALVALIAGSLVVRLGACRLSQICMIACAVGCAVASIPSVLAIAAASLAIGFAYGLTNPSSSHLLARHTSERNRSFVFSIKQTGVPIGGVAAGLATPALAVAFGWQAALIAIVPLALLVAAALARPRPRWDADRRPSAPIGGDALRRTGRLLRDRSLRWLCVCGFFYAAIQLCLMTFIVTFAVTELGFGVLAAGGLLAAVQAAGVAGRLFWGALADRLQHNVAVLALVGGIAFACAIAMSLVSPATPPVLLFLLAGLYGVSAIGWNGVFLSEAVRLAPAGEVSATAGAATFSTFTGVLVGPAAFVQLYGAVGSFSSSYAYLTVPAGLGAAACLLATRRR